MFQESRRRRSQVLLDGNAQALNAADDKRRSHDGSLAISTIWMEGVDEVWVSSFGGEALPETGWSKPFLIYVYGMAL